MQPSNVKFQKFINKKTKFFCNQIMKKETKCFGIENRISNCVDHKHFGNKNFQWLTTTYLKKTNRFMILELYFYCKNRFVLHARQHSNRQGNMLISFRYKVFFDPCDVFDSLISNISRICNKPNQLKIWISFEKFN